MATRVVINEGAMRELELEASLTALETAGMELEREMRNEAPVLTGALRDSIRKEVDSSEPAAYVGSDLNYSVFVELGTRKMAPRAFMRRALASLGGILSGSWR